MKILFDHQIFEGQRFGGISRVFYEIINKSKNRKTLFQSELSILINKNEYIKEVKEVRNYKLINKCNFKGKDRIIKYINRINSIKRIKEEKYDVFHPTYYDPYFIKYLKKPFVLTVHDMTHEKYIKDDITTINNKKVLINKADKIIAISENTKKDIIEIYNIEENKIEVIYWANSLNKISSIKCPSKYILFVGSRYKYKNFTNFLKASARILMKNKDIYIYCAGGGAFNDNEIELIKQLGIEKRIVQSFVTDEELAYLYKNAEIFVYPSLYEGFGIPILEAFNFECPVALSNTSCFPEIARDCAEYFDPNNIDDIQKAIEKVIYNKNYRDVLIEKGKKRNEDFSWEKTVKRYDDIYRSIVKNEN